MCRHFLSSCWESPLQAVFSVRLYQMDPKRAPTKSKVSGCNLEPLLCLQGESTQPKPISKESHDYFRPEDLWHQAFRASKLLESCAFHGGISASIHAENI